MCQQAVSEWGYVTVGDSCPDFFEHHGVNSTITVVLSNKYCGDLVTTHTVKVFRNRNLACHKTKLPGMTN
jgi:hypothetical protein